MWTKENWGMRAIFPLPLHHWLHRNSFEFLQNVNWILHILRLFVGTHLYFTGTKTRTLAWHQTHSCSHRLAEAAGNVITCPQIWVKWISLSLWQPPSSTPPLFASRVWGDNEVCCHAKPARDTSWAFQLLQFSPADNFETDWESRNITASYWFKSSIKTGEVWMICRVTLLHDNLVGSFWTILMHDTQHILLGFFFIKYIFKHS